MVFDELSNKHRQIANLLGYEDDSENIDEETEDIIEELVENTEDYDPDAYEEDGTEESLYLENTALKTDGNSDDVRKSKTER